MTTTQNTSRTSWALTATRFRDVGGSRFPGTSLLARRRASAAGPMTRSKAPLLRGSARIAASSIRPWASTTTPQCQLPTSTPSSPICVRCRQKSSPKAFMAHLSAAVCCWQILLQNSFSGELRKFKRLLMRSARGHVRDHIVLHKDDHRPWYGLSQALQR